MMTVRLLLLVFALAAAAEPRTRAVESILVLKRRGGSRQRDVLSRRFDTSVMANYAPASITKPMSVRNGMRGNMGARGDTMLILKRRGVTAQRDHLRTGVDAQMCKLELTNAHGGVSSTSSEPVLAQQRTEAAGQASAAPTPLVHCTHRSRPSQPLPARSFPPESC